MTGRPKILVATERTVFAVEPGNGKMTPGQGLGRRLPSALAWDPRVEGRAWLGTTGDGVFRSDDGGISWQASGLRGHRVMSVSASPAEKGLVWAGTEPSAVWRWEEGRERWEEATGLHDLPSAEDWAFPPRPETHHVRWIACHPYDPRKLWVAVEAGALVTTEDGGRSWRDRVPGSPLDTHELAIHPQRPLTLRISAGDGYFESHDGGETWTRPMEGLEVGYMRSVAVDPKDPHRVVASGASEPRTAYVAGPSDGRLYRKTDGGIWERVLNGWPEPPNIIAPLLRPGETEEDLWAADERGIHRSEDGGASWEPVGAFPDRPRHLRGFSLV